MDGIVTLRAAKDGANLRRRDMFRWLPSGGYTVVAELLATIALGPGRVA